MDLNVADGADGLRASLGPQGCFPNGRSCRSFHRSWAGDRQKNCGRRLVLDAWRRCPKGKKDLCFMPDPRFGILATRRGRRRALLDQARRGLPRLIRWLVAELTNRVRSAATHITPPIDVQSVHGPCSLRRPGRRTRLKDNVGAPVGSIGR